MTARKLCSPDLSGGTPGAEPGQESAHHLEPLDGDPGEMLPKLLQAGRAQDTIGAQGHVETTIQQVEDEVDALRVPGRLPSPEGYLGLARRPEKIRNVDEILPRQQLAIPGAGRAGPTTVGAGTVAGELSRMVAIGVISPGRPYRLTGRPTRRRSPQGKPEPPIAVTAGRVFQILAAFHALFVWRLIAVGQFR